MNSLDLKNGSDGYQTYALFCEQAANNNMLFNNFKRNPKFTYMLEHVSYAQGILYINELKKKYSHLLNMIDWEKIQMNDNIGNPEIFDFTQQLFDVVDLNNYYFSPTTLRYLVTGLDILKSIGRDKILNVIIEIGGGYGGQCKVLLDLASLFNIKILKYVILDLANPNLIQRKYIDLQNITNVECTTITNYVIPQQIDLVISNYALGEIDVEYKELYYPILKKSMNGFIIWNTSHKIPDEITSKNTYNSIAEVPQTGLNNKILTF